MLLLKEMLADERKKGFDEGYRLGLSLNYQQGILQTLNIKDEISDYTRKLILRETNLETLEQWFSFALEADSVEEFIQKIKK